MEVGELDGVESVQVDEASKKATVTFGPPATEEKIVDLLKEINYPPEQLIQLS
jgi:copper chaperone CopZ